ncbi:MAG TPA: aconitate hydratase AcnA, partial [Terriglobales bacterium]|nr:aconitate hydratase AcnA [Terriglobales bacterium]
AYCREQGLFHDENTREAEYSELLELDLASVEPSLAGPRRPQDRVPLSSSKESFEKALPSLLKASKSAAGNGNGHLHHGSVVIAAITSCTNTSNPSVMLAAGLLAKKAVERGLQVPDWVKTSLAPGSKVVRDYLEQAGLTPYLEKLKFHIVGYGCTTCIGNSGPLPEEISDEIDRKNLVVASVLSGNRNFEGRINPDVRANYLMSPPLVVAFALAGKIDIDLRKDALGTGTDGKPVYLADVWPSQREVEQAERKISSAMFRQSYGDVFAGDEHWRSLPVPAGDTYAWDKTSTYIQRAPYFDEMSGRAGTVSDITNARVLAVLGDSVTTDHISPAGSIKKDSPAGKYLQEHGVKPAEFNSYGSRRGNHEVMVRGTFANVRLRNKMVPSLEGGFTKHLPDGAEMTIFEASEKYIAEGVPLVIIAGKEYGSGSSRDWAAKGPLLLGVRVVIAESYERIHRSNLVGMGILPLQFLPGENAELLGLTGDEIFEISGIRPLIEKFVSASLVKVRAGAKKFDALVRIDTPQEALYYANGGILQYVLRQLMAGSRETVGA